VLETGVRFEDKTFLAAGLTVIATGAAAARLVPQIDVHTRKGHLVITDRYPGFVQHQLIELGYLKMHTRRPPIRLHSTCSLERQDRFW
jgi:hypothetical protein